MAKRNKTIEVCVGVGTDQLTPEYVTVEIPQMTKKQQQEVALQDLVSQAEDAGLYNTSSTVEHMIIEWSLDGTRTAGELARNIMKLIEGYE
jgi:hypothetical protein